MKTVLVITLCVYMCIYYILITVNLNNNLILDNNKKSSE